jgi:uncharacterized RDD family membrane protein YckC
MSKDMYSAPESSLGEDQGEGSDLATRGKRLSASLIDSLLIGVITLPIIYYTGAWDDIYKGIPPSTGYSIAIGICGLVAFLLINGKLLVENGQTLGKKVVGIRIVDMEGNKASIKKQLFPRYAFYFLPGQVPVVGQIVSMVNILWIFGKPRRCLHDYVAGTKVVFV